MREIVRDYLFNKYDELEYKKKLTSLKFYYKYNGVNINLYFDAYDVDSLSFSVILSYDGEYYFTSLNIMNNTIKTEYLVDIPSKMLGKILVNNKLEHFYFKMEEYILNNEPIKINYEKDKLFVNTIKYKKKGTDLPFWHHIRKVRMTDTTLNELSEHGDISRNILIQIQNQNLTLVRTGDPRKRNNLTMILGQYDIKLK
ncbi:hypothetical protein UT300007_11820 [Clostridium sp. CTA-7]